MSFDQKLFGRQTFGQQTHSVKGYLFIKPLKFKRNSQSCINPMLRKDKGSIVYCYQLTTFTMCITAFTSPYMNWLSNTCLLIKNHLADRHLFNTLIHNVKKDLVINPLYTKYQSYENITATLCHGDVDM
jgi:hypothetical protein